MPGKVTTIKTSSRVGMVSTHCTQAHCPSSSRHPLTQKSASTRPYCTADATCAEADTMMWGFVLSSFAELRKKLRPHHTQRTPMDWKPAPLSASWREPGRKQQLWHGARNDEQRSLFPRSTVFRETSLRRARRVTNSVLQQRIVLYRHNMLPI